MDMRSVRRASSASGACGVDLDVSEVIRERHPKYESEKDDKMEGGGEEGTHPPTTALERHNDDNGAMTRTWNTLSFENIILDWYSPHLSQLPQHNLLLVSIPTHPTTPSN